MPRTRVFGSPSALVEPAPGGAGDGSLLLGRNGVPPSFDRGLPCGAEETGAGGETMGPHALAERFDGKFWEIAPGGTTGKADS